MDRLALALGLALACVVMRAEAFAGSSGHGAATNSQPPSSFRVQPPSGQSMVTRPAPPLQRRFDGPRHHHHHHHDGGVVFVNPSPFFVGDPFFYPYANPYSSFYTFGPPVVYSAPPTTIEAPFFCWIDQIGFTSEERFAHHLHEVHGVPLEEALGASEAVGGRYVFFGY